MIAARAILTFLAQSGVYEAPFREPTAEETLILEYMNRFRADPSAEADLIAPPDRKDLGVDWKMFRDEMKALKPKPPLVFNLELLDAARKHSHYMTLHGLGHDEVPGRPGFTGASPGDRMKAAGYKGFGAAENAFRDSGGPWHSHWGFVVDHGEGPGGMQPGRGHRRNMIGDFREVGPGAVPHGKDRLSVTHNFGSRDLRMAGGVVYIDLNGNAFYDVGEGLGGVQVSAGGDASVLTWRSGAYSLDLKGRGPVTLVAVLDGERFTRTFPAGTDNVKFDWIVPVDVPLRKADRWLEAVEKAGPAGTPKHRTALVNLYHHTRELYLDADRKARVAELTGEVGAELDRSRKAVLDALGDVEQAGLQKLLDEQRKPWKGTEAEAWFADAEVLARLKRGVTAFLRQPKVADRDRRQMAAALEDAQRRMKTGAFKAEIDGLISKVRS